jgi:hypothetical protein
MVSDRKAVEQRFQTGKMAEQWFQTGKEVIALG